MSIQPSYPNGSQNNGKMFAGLILLGLGCLLLIKQFTFFYLPGWLFSFPMLLIVIGVFYGIKHDFKNPVSFILLLIGITFLSRHIIPGFDLRDFFWPVAIIGIGLWLIVRRNHSPDFNKRWNKSDTHTTANLTPEADYIVKPEGTETSGSNTFDNNTEVPRGEDFINSVSVFGGVKRTILSKDFKGGEIVNMFGGTEIDFTRADINGIVIIEVTQVFSGVKLIVPPHWQVRSDMAAIFAGIDDKRFGNTHLQNSDKILILKGVSIFAGVDVRSF